MENNDVKSCMSHFNGVYEFDYDGVKVKLTDRQMDEFMILYYMMNDGFFPYNIVYRRSDDKLKGLLVKGKSNDEEHEFGE